MSSSVDLDLLIASWRRRFNPGLNPPCNGLDSEPDRRQEHDDGDLAPGQVLLVLDV